MSEIETAAAAVTETAAPVASRPWSEFKTVSGVVVMTRPRLVNGKEDGWPEFCLCDEAGKPDESWINLYSDTVLTRAKRVGAERKAAKAAERAKKLTEKEAASGPSETDKLRAELSALTAIVAELTAKVAALEAAKTA